MPQTSRLLAKDEDITRAQQGATRWISGITAIAGILWDVQMVKKARRRSQGDRDDWNSGGNALLLGKVRSIWTTHRPSPTTKLSPVYYIVYSSSYEKKGFVQNNLSVTFIQVLMKPQRPRGRIPVDYAGIRLHRWKKRLVTFLLQVWQDALDESFEIRWHRQNWQAIIIWSNIAVGMSLCVLNIQLGMERVQKVPPMQYLADRQYLHREQIMEIASTFSMYLERGLNMAEYGWINIGKG